MRSQRRRLSRVSTTDDLAAVDTRGRPATYGMRVDLEQAIAGLPDGARHVFVLYEIEGYKHDEIAEMIGIAPGTSKAQLHRAKKLLRETLTK